MGRSAPLLVLDALLAGGLTGEAVALDKRLERLGEAVKRSLVACGVAASALAVGVYQGGLTVLAAVLDQAMTPAVVPAMTAVGGLLVIAIGLRPLGLARVRVANLLPAVLLAPLAAGLMAAIR